MRWRWNSTRPTRGQTDNGNFELCDVDQIECLKDLENTLRQVSAAASINQVPQNVAQVMKENNINCLCLSGCNEVDYKVQSSHAHISKKESHLNNSFYQMFQSNIERGAVSKEDIHQAVKQEELSVLKVYYKNDQIIQFRRDRLYTTEDFICEAVIYHF